MEWNGDAKLVLFIAFTVKRNEAQVLIVGRLQERTGNTQQGWRLVEMPIKGVEDPVQFGNPQRSPGAWARRILNDAAGKMRLAKTGIQAEPGRGLELLLGVDGCERAVGVVSLGRVHVLAL